MLFGLARDEYRGEGAIIDGGSFFGSSIAASACGLLRNPRAGTFDFSALPHGKPIHGYELGYLPAPKSDKADPWRDFGSIRYRLGDSFVPILEETIAPFSDVVSLNVGDLCEESWDPTCPIEICFIDVCKTIRLNAHVSKQFYPSLIPGRSVLINQDFFFDRLPWIKVTMGFLGDYFQWHGQVFTSSIYSTTSRVPADVASVDPFSEFSLDECLSLHDLAFPIDLLDRKYRYYMALSRAYLMALKHQRDQALEYLAALEGEYDDILGDESAERGNQFRLDRARRQISNGNIFKVS